MDPQYTRRTRRRSTVIVLFTLLFVSALTLFTMVVAGWDILPMLAVVAGFGVVGLLHYLVWGRREEEETIAAPPRLDEAKRR